MILFLDTVSPEPKFFIINKNKLIQSIQILDKKSNKISDKIVSKFLKLQKKFELGNQIKKLFVCSGPGSYTALRVGIAFMYGLSISKNLPLLNLSCFDLLKLGITKSLQKKTLYLVCSSNDQYFASIFSEEKKRYILKKIEGELKYSDIESIRFKYSISNFALSNNLSRIVDNKNHKIMNIVDIIKTNYEFIETLPLDKVISPIYISKNNLLR
tara:strand:+ start:1493 stop:2131 length:639 start_codon:yes stop_codon:yes gene_type:complete